MLGQGGDESMDIFALCASLFQAVTGKHPFGAGLLEILQRVTAKQPLDYPGSARFGDVLMRGLDAEVQRRPDAHELIESLTRLL